MQGFKELVFKTLQTMLYKKAGSTSRLGFYSTFEEQLSHRHLLYILSNKT